MARAQITVGRSIKKKRPKRDIVLYGIIVSNLLVTTAIALKLFGVL